MSTVRVGDQVFFEVTPSYVTSRHGTVRAVYQQTGEVQVETPQGQKMRFDLDGEEWSHCGKFMRCPWGFEPPPDMDSGWMERHYMDSDDLYGPGDEDPQVLDTLNYDLVDRVIRGD